MCRSRPAIFGLTLNEEIWEKAGKPTLPVTYEDIIPFARKLTFDKAGKRLGEAGFDPKNIAHWGMTWAGSTGAETNYIWNYLWAYGADIVNKDKNDIGFGGAQGRAALTHMKKNWSIPALPPRWAFTATRTPGMT